MNKSDLAIRVDGLGKKYSIHHERTKGYTALRDVIANKAKSATRLMNPFTLGTQLRNACHRASHDRSATEEEFWALTNVSFEIRRGDRVGIIGRNGAGKSTLLKILSRITEPSTGRVEMCGRVASLLEVGTGFHPELTGRENIYLNGAILGMTRREIHAKFDEIVDFAEVERFLDTPVKRYSSGMYVRLAFAVAAHLEPDILVVDEVLAVGDAEFQKKCIGKIGDVSKDEGRTVLFVSHNMRAIETLCNSGLFLENGKQSIFSNDIKEIISRYQNSSPTKDSQASLHHTKDGFRFHAPQLAKSNDQSNTCETQYNPDSVIVRVQRLDSIEDLSIGIALFKQGVDVPIMQSFNVDHSVHGESFERCHDDVTYSVPLKLDYLSDGEYSIQLIAAIHNRKWILRPGDDLLSAKFTFRSARHGGSFLFQQAKRNAIIMPVLAWNRIDQFL